MNKIMALVLCCLVVASSAFAAEYIIDVPEGEVVSNTVDHIGAVTAGDTLVKTGKGTWYCSVIVGNPNLFGRVEIREGVFENACKTGFFRSPTLEIFSGAKVVQLNAAAYNGKDVTIQADRGGEWDMNFLAASPLAITGEGKVSNAAGKMTADLIAGFTGSFSVGDQNISGSTLDFYDGTTASFADVVDNIKSIWCETVRSTGAETRGKIRFYQTTPATVTARIDGNPRIYTYGPTTLGNVHTDSGQMELHAPLTISGGWVNGSVANGELGYDSKMTNEFTVSGGVVFGSGAAIFGNDYDAASKVIRPKGFRIKANPYIKLIVDGGDIFMMNSISYRSEMKSGRLWWNAPYIKDTYQKTEVLFDGGRMMLWNNGSNAFTFNAVRVDAPLTLKVGESGGIIESFGSCGPNVNFNGPICTACEEGTKDGGLELRGGSTWNFFQPVTITGPLRASGGTLYITTEVKDSVNPFGTGDLEIGNAILESKFNGTIPLLAGGTDARLSLVGAAHIKVPLPTKTDQYFTFGGLVRAKGGALFLGQEGTTVIDGTKSTVKVVGGVESTDVGLPKVPVFQVNQEYSSAVCGIDFMQYDETVGFCKFADYIIGVTGGVDSVALVDDKNVVTCPAGDVRVGAIKVSNALNGPRTDSDSKSILTIGAGSRLFVGDGVNPGCVILTAPSDYRFPATIRGAGELAFGTSEGVFAVNGGSSAQVATKITGQVGVSFVSAQISSAEVILSAENDYDGGTWINGMSVYPKCDLALSSGPIHLGNGYGRGGRLALKSPVTLANDIYISGAGCGKSDASGAVLASTNAVLTGKVVLEGTTYLGATGAATELRFDGVISGDEILVIRNSGTDTVEDDVVTSYARDRYGRVVFAGANTYNAFTQVVRANLVLRGAAATAGTGRIELDSGRLRIENAGPKTIPNRIYGTGEVQLAGNGAVTFEDVSDKEGYGMSLDLAKRINVVNSLKGFSAITTAKTGIVHLSVLDDAEGSFAGEVPENVVLHYGKAYTPGLMLILR